MEERITTDKKWNALFNKALELWLTDTSDAKGRPTSDAMILKFPAIKARPKANAEKLVPFFNNNNATWVFAKKGDTTGTSVYNGYEYCNASIDGKTPTFDWEPVRQSGFDVTVKPAKGVKKKIYFVRSAAKASNGDYFPASKQFKVTPAAFAATPKLKIDYKNEKLKLKRGLSYSVDGGKSYTTVEEKSGHVLNVPDLITAKASIYVRLNATGKKPASLIQEIIPLERRTVMPANLTCAKGKITTSLKSYEIQDPKTGKWGGLPKTTSSVTYYIRLKQTKAAAKSKIYVLDIKYGIVAATNKNGIVSATIKPYGIDVSGDAPAFP